MGKGVQVWKENKFDKTKAHVITAHHDSISLPEFLRFVALGLCNNMEFHKGNIKPSPFVRTKL